MENRNFFEIIEKKLGICIPQRIKSHMKFHNMDSFPVAAKLNEEAILDIEGFARCTLHQILQPDEMIQYYGSHFQKIPTLFVFTLGERMHLNEIKQICQDVCDERERFPNKCKVNSDLTKLTEKLTISPEHSGPRKQNVETTNIKETKKREPSKPGGGNKYIPPNMREGTAIRIANLSENTTEQEIEELVKPYGPIHKLFLAKDKNTQLCKGFGYINFKFKNDAAKAIEKLHGHRHNLLILTFEWSKPQTHNNN